MLYESKYYGTQNLGDSIMHYGVKGQKWGLRRYQNADMSLTPEGRIHYGVGQGRKNSQKFSEQMYKKYGLLEAHPKKDQAWDNSFDMWTKGASDKEIRKYLEENGLSYDDNWKSQTKHIKGGEEIRGEALLKQMKQAHSDVLKTYDVDKNADALTPYVKNVEAAKNELSKHADRFIESEDFMKYVERGVNRRVDDDELKELVYMELDDARNGKIKMKSTAAFDLAYPEWTMDDPDYTKLNNNYKRANDEFNKKSYDLASKSYGKAGSQSFRDWSDVDASFYGIERKDSQKRDKEMLAFLMRDAAEKKVKKNKLK